MSTFVDVVTVWTSGRYGVRLHCDTTDPTDVVVEILDTSGSDTGNGITGGGGFTGDGSLLTNLPAGEIVGQVTVAKGGTGAMTAADARTNLGLAIGTDVQAYDADLAALAALAATAGIVSRTGAGAFAVRTLTAPAAGLTISNPTGSGGDPTFALADDLAALEALTGTSTIYYRSGTSTWSAVTIGAGISFSAGTLAASLAGSETAASFTGTMSLLFGGSANGTWYSTDGTSTLPSVTLPAAGTYVVYGYARVLIDGVAGEFPNVSIRLYNSTDGAAISNSESIGLLNDTGVRLDATAFVFALVTVAASKTIILQAKRDTGTTWSLAAIGSDSNGRTKVGYVQVQP